MNLERELKRFVRQVRPGLIGPTSNSNVNLAQLIDELRANTRLREELTRTLGEFLASRDFTTALTETGLTLESGLFAEIFKRLEYKLLPKPVETSDVLSFLRRVFDSPSDGAWLESIDRDLFGEFLTLILPPHEQLTEPLAAQLFLSLEILSLRLAGLGFEPVVTHRLRARSEFRYAFMDVVRHVHLLLEKGDAALEPLRESLNLCGQAAQWVRSRRDVEGVSLALTYRLIKIQQVVDRMLALLRLIESILGEWSPLPARELFFHITLAEIRRFELRGFLGNNIELLAFQITEHTGRAGEHYITQTRSEWRWMAKSAALGGAVVAVLVVIKFLVAKLGLPLGPETLLFGLNYAAGFVVILLLGGTLATKQPAMTASTLASSLDVAAASHKEIEGLAEVILRTLRSQLVAMLGNFSLALVVALAISVPLAFLGWPILASGKAAHVLDSLHGFKSLSLLYAAEAGVCLFLCGLLAGFADNWFIFNHVGSRLRHSDALRKLVGPQNLDRAIHAIDQNLGAWVGNVSLGFLLAVLPALGILTGLPLDVRHVTFASGQFGVALASLKFDVSWVAVLTVGMTVLVLGLINLAVSFSLTLFVVVKSRKIRFAQTPLLMKTLWARVRKSPFEVLLPLSDPP